MTDEPSAGDPVIAEFASGASDAAALNCAIAEAWRAALSDPQEAAEIAALLGGRGEGLDPEVPPLRADGRGSGTFGAEILIVFAGGVALGVAKDLGVTAGEALSKAVRAVLKRLWDDHLQRRVSPPGKGHLGPEKAVADPEG